MNERFRNTRLTLALLMVLLLHLGCASSNLLTRRTPVPASNIYCLRESTDAGFRSNLKTSYAMYGTRKLGALGAGSVCDLIEFDNYVVNWETKDGRRERFEFDFEKIMRRFQDETPQIYNLTQHSSQPKLTIEYQTNQIEIYYQVSQYQLEGMEMRNGLQILTKPAIITKFPLLTVPIQKSTN